MKELLQRYRCESRWQVYSALRQAYFNGYIISVTENFSRLDINLQKEFLNSMSPYDPAYTFFSTMGFAETV